MHDSALTHSKPSTVSTVAANPTQIFEIVGEILVCWTVGGVVLPAVPKAWESAIQCADPNETQLRLLVLVGQFLAAVVITQPSISSDKKTALRVLPDIPKLEYPLLPEELRPSARHFLEEINGIQDIGFVLEFLALRGWSISPADWMPTQPHMEFPDIYARWIDWALIAKGKLPIGKRQPEELNVSTWDNFYPEYRFQLFKALRRQNPDAARTLLEAKLKQENQTTVRLSFVDALSEQLSESDTEFLKNLANKDISPKVKLRANRLLACLGHGPVASREELTELAGFFVLEEKKSDSRRVLEPNFKSDAQRDRCFALIKKITFTEFAAAFNCTPLEVAELLHWENIGFYGDVLELRITELAIQTMPAETLFAVTKRLPMEMYTVEHIVPFLPLGQLRTKIMLQTLENGKHFIDIFDWAGTACKLDAPLMLPAGERLMKDLLDIQSKSDERQRQIEKELLSGEPTKVRTDAMVMDIRMGIIESELHAVGMLASHAGAVQILDQFAQSGINWIPQHWLEALVFNAALEDRKPALEIQQK
jgi:hypothetical protein